MVKISNKKILVIAGIIVISVFSLAFRTQDTSAKTICEKSPYSAFSSVIALCREGRVAALWVAANDGTCKNPINITSAQASGKITVQLCGMYEKGQSAYKATHVKISNDGGSLSYPSPVARGKWGSPKHTNITMDVKKFINGASATKVTGGMQYKRTIKVYRCNGRYVSESEKTSSQFCGSDNEKVKVFVADPPAPPPPQDNYNTTPSANITEEIVYPDEPTNISAKIDVSPLSGSSGTDIGSATIQVINFTTSQGLTNDNAKGGIQSSAPCAFYESKVGARDCEAVATPTQSLKQGIGYNYTGKITVPKNISIGDKYCVAIGVKPANSNNKDKWNISNLSCRTIAKKPSLQVENSSVHSSGTINTSTSTKQTTRRTYGSWGEYLVIAGGNIKGMSSGGALSGGFSDSNFCKLSPLTITNNECKTNSNSTLLGNSGIASQNFASRIIAYYDNIKDEGGVQTTTAPTNIADASFGSGNIIRITGSGTTTITGNITNSDPSNPKIILADGSINIRDSVTDINAWLISKGTINTCDGIDNPSNVLTSDKCNQSLTINGIASAKKILFYRTAGAERYDYSKSAEIFNFTPSIYGYGYQESLKHTSKPSTVYTHELPPRY